MTIRFGTDGWRAVISDMFTFENLRVVAQAVADYVREVCDGQEPEVVVGFDTRFLSDRYAREVARVMAGNGVTAHLTRADAPTPAVSYAIVDKQAHAGVMITASHNPPRYNGLKLKAAFGGSVLPEQAQQIEALLARNQREARGPNLMAFDEATESGLIRRFDPAWAYYQHLSTLVDLDAISTGELRVVTDAMYGSGRGAFRDLLSRTRCSLYEIRGEMNPGFGGIHPEPAEHNLQALTAALQAHHADIGLALDGDADRIGAMDARGHYVDAHHIFALVLRYLVEVKEERGAVIKTVSTTRMVDRLAQRYDLPLHETPVGFNHIAKHILEGEVLIGGEESGGLSIRGHIPEGDGILMGLLLLEIMAEADEPLHELISDIQATYGPTCYTRRDLPLGKPVSKAKMVARLQDMAPARLAGKTVVEVQDINGEKYLLAEEAWLLIRPSGTEPVLRVYAEGHDAEEVDALVAYGAEVALGD